MNTQNDWIKMSERRPTGADLPVWFYWPNGEISFVTRGPAEASQATHWKKADIPAPPKPESQRERDIAAFEQHCRKRWGTAPMDQEDSWLQALDHERAWFRKELEKIERQDIFGASEIILEMKERCAEERT